MQFFIAALAFAGSAVAHPFSSSIIPTPASSTTPVISSTPGSSTPVSSTPVSSTPVSSTPVMSTPVMSTPAMSTPVSSTPVSSTPVSSTPASSSSTAPEPECSVDSDGDSGKHYGWCKNANHYGTYKNGKSGDADDLGPSEEN